MKTQLLCTFTKRNRLNEAVDIIVSCNDILYDKISAVSIMYSPALINFSVLSAISLFNQPLKFIYK